MGAADAFVGLSLVFVRAIARSLTELGLAGEEFLVALGVSAEAPDDEQLPTPRVEMALRAIGKEQREPCLGLALARKTRVGGLGIFDYAVWTSVNLREALARWSEYFRILTRSIWLEVGQRSEEAHVSLRVPRGMAPGIVLEDLTFGAVFLRAGEMLGRQWRIESASFRHAETDRCAAEAFFGAPVAFDQPVDELVFDARFLDTPSHTADSVTSRLVRPHASARFQLRAVDPFLDRVRSEVMRSLSSKNHTLVSLSRELGTSARTLQRQLQARGTSLRRVVDDVRKERVFQLLAGAKTSTHQIAVDAGFAGGSPFHRAFRRWTGKSPSEYLTSLGESPPPDRPSRGRQRPRRNDGP
jgi:AraC-like DNA-binding protein